MGTRVAVRAVLLLLVASTIAGAQEPVRQFDFGADGSPVAAGYVGVTPATAYDRDRGYGWGEHATLTGTDKAQAGDLERDFVYGYAATGDQAAHFLVDLPDGDYWAIFYAGDLQYARGDTPMDILINGEAVVESWGVQGWSWRAAPFTVTGGQVDVVLRSSQAPGQRYSFWLLNALVILRGGTEEQARTQADTVARAEQEAWIAANYTERLPEAVLRVRPEQLTDDPMSLVNTSPTASGDAAPITDADRQRGYITFARSLTETVYPGTLPTAEERGRELRCADAPGAYCHLTFGLVPLQDLGRCEVTVSDLSGPQATIPASAATVYLGRISRERSGRGQYTWQPKVLDPTSSAEIPRGASRWWWVILHLPDQQRPGQYRGSITFTPENGPPQELPVQVQVHPFTVPAPPGDVTGMYWAKSYLRYPENMRKQFQDLREHGCNAITTGESPRGGFAPDGTLTLDFTVMDEVYRVAREEGLTGPSPWFNARLASLIQGDIATPEGQESYRRLIAAIAQHAQEAGWPPLLFYPVDEPSVAEIETYLPLIRQVPGALTYCTPNNIQTGLATVQHMDYACWQHQSANTQTREATLAAGRQFWYYSSNYGESSATARIRSGFLRWRLRATGMFYWHYQAPRGDPYNALDSASTDHCVAYPTPEGPIPSIGWEGERAGINDYRYARLLEDLMARAGPDSAAARAARQVLDRLTAEIPDDGKQCLSIPENWTGATFDAYREEIAGHIMALRTELGLAD